MAGLTEHGDKIALVSHHDGQLVHDAAGGLGQGDLHPLRPGSQFYAFYVNAVHLRYGLHRGDFKSGGRADPLAEWHIRFKVERKAMSDLPGVLLDQKIQIAKDIGAPGACRVLIDPGANLFDRFDTPS